jgi:hypothetical protein
VTIEDGGGQVEEGVSASAGDKGGWSAGWGIRACGREESVSGGEVLIAPAPVVSGREFGEFAEPDFMEMGTGERFEGWVGGSIIANQGRG